MSLSALAQPSFLFGITNDFLIDDDTVSEKDIFSWDHSNSEVTSFTFIPVIYHLATRWWNPKHKLRQPSPNQRSREEYPSIPHRIRPSILPKTTWFFPNVQYFFKHERVVCHKLPQSPRLFKPRVYTQGLSSFTRSQWPKVQSKLNISQCSFLYIKKQ